MEALPCAPWKEEVIAPLHHGREEGAGPRPVMPMQQGQGTRHESWFLPLNLEMRGQADCAGRSSISFSSVHGPVYHNARDSLSHGTKPRISLDCANLLKTKQG